MEVSMAKSKKIKKHRKFWLVVKILILVILLTVLGGGLFLYLKYGDEVIGMQQEAKELVAQSTEDTFRSSETVSYTHLSCPQIKRSGKVCRWCQPAVPAHFPAPFYLRAGTLQK